MKIYSRTPSRISLYGSGSDLPIFYKQYGGLVISMAINIYQHITLSSDDDLFELASSTFPYRASPQFLFNILNEFGIGGMHTSLIKSTYDGFTQSGLGSSAAAAVCLIGAINKRLHLNLSNREIAKKAYGAEINMGWSTGLQDQYACLYGGINTFGFGEEITIQPFKREVSRIVDSLTLFYIGNRTLSSNIQLELLTQKQIETLKEIKQIAYDARVALEKLDIAKLGKLLDTSWKLKKKSNSKASTPTIDYIYEYARENGAIGGKICGSGGGGYMIFMTLPQDKQFFIEKMKQKNHENIDFEVDFQGLSTRIL